MYRKKSEPSCEQLDRELQTRLELAAIPRFGPAFSDNIVLRLQENTSVRQSLWNCLSVFGRPILVSASMITLLMLLLHLLFNAPVNTDPFETTALSFDVMLADAK